MPMHRFAHLVRGFSRCFPLLLFLVAGAAREDGVLLKPGRPALALDSVWYGRLFPARLGRHGSGGEVSATYTEVGNLKGLRWYDVLGWGTDSTVTLDDLMGSTGSPVRSTAPA